MSESILAVLDRESIRLVDGRYSTGFANMEDLQKLIDMGGDVEVYDNQGMKFVRKHIVPAAQQSVQATAATPRKTGKKSTGKVARKSRRAANANR